MKSSNAPQKKPASHNPEIALLRARVAELEQKLQVALIVRGPTVNPTPVYAAGQPIYFVANGQTTCCAAAAQPPPPNFASGNAHGQTWNSVWPNGSPAH